jgi:glycine/D-amino acid oxidase-like deaminating enzyme
LLRAAEIRGFGFEGIHGGVLHARGAQIRPDLLLKHLLRSLREAGGQIHEHSRVVAVESSPAGAVARLRASTVSARWILVATNAGVGALLPSFRSKVIPFRAHALATARAVSLPALPPGFIGRGELYWRWERRRLLTGGDETRPMPRVKDAAGARRAVYAEVTQGLRHLLPRWSERAVARRWSGVVDVSLDGLPFVGPVAPRSRIAVATGFTGLGFSYGFEASRWLARICMEAEDPTPALFRAQRAVMPDASLANLWRV